MCIGCDAALLVDCDSSCAGVALSGVGKLARESFKVRLGDLRIQLHEGSARALLRSMSACWLHGKRSCRAVQLTIINPPAHGPDRRPWRAWPTTSLGMRERSPAERAAAPASTARHQRQRRLPAWTTAAGPESALRMRQRTPAGQRRRAPAVASIAMSGSCEPCAGTLWLAGFTGDQAAC